MVMSQFCGTCKEHCDSALQQGESLIGCVKYMPCVLHDIIMNMILCIIIQ